MTKSEPEALDRGTLILAYLCVRDVDGLPSQVQILDRFRLLDKDIATICGAAVQSVRNARVQYKKPKKGSKKGRP
jgi:hypothetical protein